LAGVVAANGADLATGDLLVATAKSHDPDFAKSVIVLIHYDSESATGLMLNKPTDVPVSDVLPGAKRGAVVYAGGPVAIGVRGLARTKSTPFFSLVTNRAELLRRVESGAPSSEFRVYAGYVGWTARQLRSEVERGLWRVMAADGKALWPGLTRSRAIR
jgi:putative transcriptional regulator